MNLLRQAPKAVALFRCVLRVRVHRACALGTWEGGVCSHLKLVGLALARVGRLAGGGSKRLLVPYVALDEGLEVLNEFGEGRFVPMDTEERLVRAFKGVVRFGHHPQSHDKLVDPGEFCGLDVGMETIGFPKVLEFLELLVVPHDVRVGVASWGAVCRNLSAENNLRKSVLKWERSLGGEA